MDTQIIRNDKALSSNELKTRTNLIRQVMKELMVEDTHYGKIPGCPKASLWKPGAELIASTFKIAIKSVDIEDLSGPDEKRYRVTCEAYSNDGDLIGSSVGECSSNEEKYKWRRPVCDAEFDEAPFERKRKKWKKDGTQTNQVRTEPSDLANTILQMADKRAYVAVVRKVTAASDVFTQDIEDLDPLPVDGQDVITQQKPKIKKSSVNSGDFRKMPSKYENKCKTCGGKIKIDDVMMYSKTLGVHHPECLEPKKEKAEETVVSEGMMNNLKTMAIAAGTELIERIGVDGFESLDLITPDYAQTLLEEFAKKIDGEKL